MEGLPLRGLGRKQGCLDEVAVVAEGSEGSGLTQPLEPVCEQVEWPPVCS